MDKQLPSWDEWIAKNTGSMGQSDVGGYSVETRDMMKRAPKMEPIRMAPNSPLAQDLAMGHKAMREAWARENRRR